MVKPRRETGDEPRDTEELRLYAMMRGYDSPEQMYQLRADFGRDEYGRIAEHVKNLYRQGDIAGLEQLYRDLYDLYHDAYVDDLDDLNNALHAVVSPSHE